MMLLRRTPTSNPTLVHLVQTRSDADLLLQVARGSTFLGIDLEFHAAIPTAPAPPSLDILAHRRLARPSSVSPSQFSRAVAKVSRPPFSIPRPIVSRAAWPSLQFALPPSTATPEERHVAYPDPEQRPECTHVFIVPLATLSDEPWRLDLIHTLFTADKPPTTFVFHGAGNDLAVLGSRFRVAPPPGTVIDLQVLYNEWSCRQMRPMSHSPQVEAPPALPRPPQNPGLNDLLAFLNLPTNPFKGKTKRTAADLVAYAAYDVDQLIPAYHTLQRLLLTC